MNVALYTRATATDPACEAQLTELRAYCAVKRMAIAHEFRDGIAGAKSDHEAWDKLMGFVRARSIHAVLAVRIDRMAPSLRRFSRLARDFITHGVAMIFPGQSIDTSDQNPCGRSQAALLSVVSELERDLISEGTKSGLAGARSKGAVIGRHSPKLPTMAIRKQIIEKWIADGRPGGYEKLGALLGGVARATAWRLAKKAGFVLPEPEVLDVG